MTEEDMSLPISLIYHAWDKKVSQYEDLEDEIKRLDKRLMGTIEDIKRTKDRINSEMMDIGREIDELEAAMDILGLQVRELEDGV